MAVLSEQFSLLKTLRTYAGRPQTGVQLKQLLLFGQKPSSNTMQQSAMFLHAELPVRLAHRVKELDSLPYGMCMMPSVRMVRNWYLTSFEELVKVKQPKNSDRVEDFTKLLGRIFERHAPTLSAMGRGVYELRKELLKSFDSTVTEDDISDYIDVRHYLDNFYSTRIGIRMLIGQHLELAKQVKDPDKDYVGLICQRTNAGEVARDAVDAARHVVGKHYPTVPEVEISGGETLRFPYVPSHLYYVMFELLKNSLRATVEFHNRIDGTLLPPVKILIVDQNTREDVSVKISDCGGGIPRSKIHKLWSYMYTTAKVRPADLTGEHAPDFATEAPLAGFAHGLPISRLHARYFGGELQVVSLEGLGTDAYIHLNILGNSEEPLP